MSEHSPPSPDDPENPYRLNRRPMPSQSQLNAIATTLLKLKRAIYRLPDGHRQKALTEAIRQLESQKSEELIKDEQNRASD